MKYTIYKITNELDGKIYIGCHKTNNLDDSYMGSGKYLINAQEKHGIENFTKEILQVFDNPEDMFQMESVLVNKEFVQSKETYNLKQGGYGGWEFINNNGLSNTFNRELNIELGERGRAAQKILREIDEDWVIRNSKAISEGMKKYYDENEYHFTGKKHTEESKKAIGRANSKHQQGEGNSQYGTMWIHNLELKLSKKIKKEELPTWEQDGWLKGRKIKF